VNRVSVGWTRFAPILRWIIAPESGDPISLRESGRIAPVPSRPDPTHNPVAKFRSHAKSVTRAEPLRLVYAVYTHPHDLPVATRWHFNLERHTP
jgi:hypothetical protein